ncbi:hypothetical protein Ciccas_013396 [Cichlidogyrus casuarinus]|uniref:Uncharacterized protein n=1 Tax=Cichlidogyrus casuarinus TaxID=1844966 RepID=A0ABD2PKP6_9PLAT
MDGDVAEQSPTDGNSRKMRRHLKLLRSTSHNSFFKRHSAFGSNICLKEPQSKRHWSKLKHVLKIKHKSECIDEEGAVSSDDEADTQPNLEKDIELENRFATEFEMIEQELSKSEELDETSEGISKSEVVSKLLLFKDRTWTPEERLKKANEMHDELVSRIDDVRLRFMGKEFLIKEIIRIGCILETLNIISKTGLFATTQFCESVRSVKNYYCKFERKRTWHLLVLLVNYRVNFTCSDEPYLVIEEVLKKIEQIYIVQMKTTEETARVLMNYKDDTLVRTEYFFKGNFKEAFEKKNDIQLYDEEARKEATEHSRSGFHSMPYSKNKPQDSEIASWQVNR